MIIFSPSENPTGSSTFGCKYKEKDMKCRKYRLSCYEEGAERLSLVWKTLPPFGVSWPEALPCGCHMSEVLDLREKWSRHFFFVSLPWARTCLHRLVKANWYALLGERKSTSFYPEKMRIRILVWNEIQCGGSNNIFGLKKTLLRKVVHVFVWQLLLFLKWFLIVTPPNLTQATPNFLLKSFFTSGQSIGQL